MRFQKECKVEVFRKREAPPGSWHFAEIVCGNQCGDYTVKYTGARNRNIVEKVCGKVIRPCAPLSEFSEKWVPGDIVEVFDGESWKMATVSKTLQKNQFLVRLLGFSLEFKVSRVDIRVRQSWEDGKWVVIGQGSANCDNGKHDQRLCKTQNFSSQVRKTNMQAKADCFSVENKTIIQGSRYGSISKNLKRSQAYENYHVENCVGAAKKLRGLERRKSNDADTMTCSVGSCSVFGSNVYQLPRVGPSEDFGSLSDAESCCQDEHEDGNGQKMAAEIHEIELHAYRRTIGALHACGPLSWEQEELVTNLRLLLNISNDEHLLEIKSLISAAAFSATRKHARLAIFCCLGINGRNLFRRAFLRLKQLPGFIECLSDVY
ncbi:hypothetical protein ACFE04_003588 [Oxalis oulophora]